MEGVSEGLRTVAVVNWTEFLATSFVATILAAVQAWVARGRRVARLRRDAVDAAQLAVALETLGAASSLCDQARAESMVAARRALSTAKPSWMPPVLGFLSILVLAWVATQVLPNAADSLWSWPMFGVGLVIAVLAWGVEWLCRWIGGRFVRAPDNLSTLTTP